MDIKDKIASDEINVIPVFDIEAIVACFHRVMREKDITKTELAALADVPLPTLSKILDHTTKDPRFESVARIARALNISLNTLTELAIAPDASLPSGLPEGEQLTRFAIRHLVTAYQQIIYTLRKQIQLLEKELAEKKPNRVLRDILLVVSFVGLVFYLVWDLTHPTDGVFQYQVYARQLSQWMTDIFAL